MTGELAKTIDELLQAYFDGDYARGDIYGRFLALVPVHGADAVFEALPPPWRHTFYDWARDTLGGDTPVEELITIGASAPDHTAVYQIRDWLAAHPEPPADPPTPPEVEDYFVLTEDQIDFSTVDSSTLFHLATQTTEPFIATSALGALADRKTRETRDAAETILVRPIWDRFLTAYAIRILYGADPLRARELMTRYLAEEEPVILDEMVDLVLENPDDFAKGKRRELATKLAARVAASAPGPHSRPERRAELVDLYGGKES